MNHAKALQRACAERDPQALSRVIAGHAAYAGAAVDDIDSDAFSLRDAQLILAREYGADNWQALASLFRRRPASGQMPGSGPSASDNRRALRRRSPVW